METVAETIVVVAEVVVVHATIAVEKVTNFANLFKQLHSKILIKFNNIYKMILGHISRDCTEPRQERSGGGGGRSGGRGGDQKCYNCQGFGHISRDCPEGRRD